MKELLRVFGFVRRYPWFAIGTLGCALISMAAAMVYPKLTGWIIDDVIAPGRPERLLPAVCGLIAAFFCRDAFNSIRILLNNTFEQNVIFDIRTRLYDTLQRLPLGWFDNRASGDLMTRVTEDVTNMERVLIDGIEQGSVAVLQVLAVGVILTVTNPSLAGWALLPIPVLVLGASLYTGTAHRRHRIIRRATSAMNALLLDNLGGIQQIKSFGREDSELVHFKGKAEAVRQGTLKVMRAWAIYNPGMNFAAFTGFGLVLYFGGREVIDAESGFRIGDLTAFLLYLGLFYEPINRLHGLNQLFQAGRAAAERVYAILDSETERDLESTYRLPPSGGRSREVVFENVKFAYREGREVLENINLRAAPGMTVALVGPTGAGKSSLVQLLPRFYPLLGGRILIDGIPHVSLALAELRAQIGIVSQEPFLFNASVSENLIFGRPDCGEDGFWKALRAANAEEFVRALPEGLGTVVGERGVKLSVGEKQRLSIARALLKDPPILILDEATASVDTHTERLIQEALDRLLADRTSFVIAHRLSTIRSADLICVLRDGRIVESGNHDALYNAGGLYARLCRAQHTGETIEETFDHLT